MKRATRCVIIIFCYIDNTCYIHPFMFHMLFHCFNDRQFAFEDQYGLVLDHLKILEDQETIERNGNINQMDQDEEWSVDDDNDEDYKDDDGEDGKDNDGNMD